MVRECRRYRALVTAVRSILSQRYTTVGGGYTTRQTGELMEVARL